MLAGEGCFLTYESDSAYYLMSPVLSRVPVNKQWAFEAGVLTRGHGRRS